MMGMKRVFLSAVVIVILLSSGLPGTNITGGSKASDTEDLSEEVTRSSRSSYDYDNIYIRDDDGLLKYVSDNGCEGNGTEEDPYVIKDLMIDMKGSMHNERCVSIKRISLHLFLVNLTLKNSYIGLRIDECSNLSLIHI
jgi:hypothetical protein